MNRMAEAFMLGLQRSDGFIRFFTSGMEGEDWLSRPAGATNSAIWILGHLAQSRANFLELLTGEKTQEEGWEDLFGLGVERQDPSAYPDVETIRAALTARMDDLTAYLESASEEELEGPPAIPSKSFETKADVLVHMTHHEAHHTGALSMLRRQLGKERLI